MAISFINKATMPGSSSLPVMRDISVIATSGSPSVATYSSEGIDYKTYKFTGTGSITFSKGGLIDVMLLGGGGGGGDNHGGGGGAGMYILNTNYFVQEGTITIEIGAGGTRYANGGISSIGLDYNTFKALATGGGAGGYTGSASILGNTGGGGNGNDSGTPLSTYLGYKGGTGGGWGWGGGGAGIGGNGSNAAYGDSYGGNGGPGISSTFITGSDVLFGGGGGGAGYTVGGSATHGGGAGAVSPNYGGNGTANTGGGGGGTGNPPTGGGTGGSGFAVVRVLQ